MTASHRVVCPHCNATVCLDPAAAPGATVACEHCGGEVTVPAPREAPTPVAETSLAGSPDDRAMTLVASPDSSTLEAVRPGEVQGAPRLSRVEVTCCEEKGVQVAHVIDVIVRQEDPIDVAVGASDLGKAAQGSGTDVPEPGLVGELDQVGRGTPLVARDPRPRAEGPVPHAWCCHSRSA